MTPWKGKWALVTGASAGIGVALARELATGGTNLVFTARRTNRLETLARELASTHRISAEICSAALAQQKAPEEIFRFTLDKRIEIDVLINNAGFGQYGEFTNSDTKRLLDMVQVNCAAVVHLSRLYLPDMVRRRS